MLRCASILTVFIVLLVSTLVRADEIVVQAVGDIMLGGRWGGFFDRVGYDYPFAATREILRQGDLTIGNLETPLTNRGREYGGKRFRFRTSPAAASALKEAGFAVLTLANNHMLDYGVDGLADTVHVLDRAGLRHSGAGTDLAEARRAVLLAVKGKRIAVLSYSLTQPVAFFAGPRRAGTAPGWPGQFREDIRNARRQADYVIVAFHWGREGETSPSAVQVRTAHAAIDAGADVVIGHHPHVLQGIERYKRGVVLYSLGNFAFASMSRVARNSVIARIVLADGVRGVELVPVNVLNREVRFQPRPLSADEGAAVVGRLGRISGRYETTVTRRDGRYFVVLREQLARLRP